MSVIKTQEKGGNTEEKATIVPAPFADKLYGGVSNLRLMAAFLLISRLVPEGVQISSRRRRGNS